LSLTWKNDFLAGEWAAIIAVIFDNYLFTGPIGFTEDKKSPNDYTAAI
jgi:hypothetical protein